MFELLQFLERMISWKLEYEYTHYVGFTNMLQGRKPSQISLNGKINKFTNPS